MEEIFLKYKIFNGRMISFSKSLYTQKLYPYNTVFFDAKISIIKEDEIFTINTCDIDISLEGDILKEIAKEINNVIYINYKSEDISTKEKIINNAVWDTNKETPYVTKESIKKEKKRQKENLRLSRIATIKKTRQYILENKKQPISDLKTEFEKELELPIEYINQKIEEFKKEFYSIKKPNKNKGILFKKYFKDYGYFTYYILDNYLSKELNIKEDKIIDPSSIWMSRKTNKYLRKIDFEIEKMFNKNFKYTDFGRYVTCNYCIHDISYLVKNNINIKSYKDNVLYIRDRVEKDSCIFV